MAVDGSEKADASELSSVLPVRLEPTSDHPLYDVEEGDYSVMLRLHETGLNANGRVVPGICAVCLCQYEAGDNVTWSPETACQHAFHSDCIVTWLSKKEEPKCPICRQQFCRVVVNEDHAERPPSSTFFLSDIFPQTSFLAVDSNGRLVAVTRSNTATAAVQSTTQAVDNDEAPTGRGRWLSLPAHQLTRPELAQPWTRVSAPTAAGNFIQGSRSGPELPVTQSPATPESARQPSTPSTANEQQD